MNSRKSSIASCFFAGRDKDSVPEEAITEEAITEESKNPKQPGPFGNLNDHEDASGLFLDLLVLRIQNVFIIVAGIV